jgi:hypothetical protein
VKKYIYKKIISRIPKSRILTTPDRIIPEQAIEMKSIHGTPIVNDVESIRSMKIEEFIQEIVSDQEVLYNVRKYNKNLISFSGISILVAFLFLMTVIAIGSRYGWISLIHSQYYWYINFYCLPVILPTIYFMRKPNHLVVVMKDLNLL